MQMKRCFVRANLALLLLSLFMVFNTTPAIAAITSLNGDLQQPSTASGNRYVDVTTDSFGNFHAIWRPFSESPLFVGSYDSVDDTWTDISFTTADVSDQVTGTLNCCFSDHVGIAVDSSGNRHVTFRSGFVGTDSSAERAIFYGMYNGAVWDFDTVFITSHPTGNRNTANPRIVVNSSGVPSITFKFFNTDPSERDQSIEYTTRNGGTWSAPVSIDDVSGNNLEMFNGDFVLDSMGKAHVTYKKEFGGGFDGNLFYATNATGPWVSTQVANGGVNSDIRSNSIDLDGNDKVHIAYQQVTGVRVRVQGFDIVPSTLFIIDNTGSSFGSPATVDTASPTASPPQFGSAGALNSLSIEGSNKTIIHHDFGDLRVSYKLGNDDWVTETRPIGSDNTTGLAMDSFISTALRGTSNSSGQIMALYHRNGPPNFTGRHASYLFGTLPGGGAVDNEAPTWSVPANITVSTDAGVSTAVVAYTATPADNVGVTSSSCTPASGATFSLGATPVNCTADDAAGNTGTASFTVTVDDNEDPTWTVPADITVSTDAGVSTAVVAYTATPADNVGVTSFSCFPASGATFSLGATTVNCMAGDAAGNTGTASFTVTVVTVASDLDGDGDVDMDDLNAVVACFGQTAPLAPPCDAADVAPPPDGDGVINILDISFIGSNFTP